MRLALVQPRSSVRAEEEHNVKQALGWMDQAADEAADLVVFPEGYPGPATPANTYDALAPVAECARRHEMHVVASRIEPVSGADGAYYMTLHMIGPAGETIGVYRRNVPEGPYVYHDIEAWKFDYRAGPPDLPVFDTALGRIGLQVCSEVYATEPSRILALKGADLILYPAGGAINELIPAWRTMVWARAIENLVYTAVTQNLYSDDEQGVALIAGPEEIIAQSADEGLVIASLDPGRLTFLRSQDERIEFPKRYRTVPGLWRWRRPESYGDLLEDGFAGVRDARSAG